MNHSNAKTVWTSDSGLVSIAVAGDIVIALQSGKQVYQHGLKTAAKNLFVRAINQSGVYSIGGTKLCVKESDLVKIKKILAAELECQQASEQEEQKVYDVVMNEFNPALKGFIKKYGSWENADAKEDVYAADVLRDWQLNGEKFLKSKGL